MKILQVIHRFFQGSYGGVETYTNRLARVLSGRGHEVSVMFPENVPGFDSVELEETSREKVTLCKVLMAPPKPWVARKWYLLLANRFYLEVSNPLAEFFFRRFIEDRKFDLVHFQHLYEMFPFTLVGTAKSFGLPVCFTLHDAWLICPRTHLYIWEKHVSCEGPTSVRKCVDCLTMGAVILSKSSLYEIISKRQESARRILEEADFVMAPSRYLADIFVNNDFSGKGIIVSPLGVDNLEQVHAIGENKGTLTIGFIGNLNPLKNVDLLVEAFKSVGGDARLVLWGGGTKRYLSKISRSIRNDSRIEYRGAYSPERLGDILSHLDVVVVPSIIESYSIVVREALAAKVPVIASRVGGIPEAIEHMRNGILFESGNVRELASRLREIVQDRSILHRLRGGIKFPRSLEDEAEMLDSVYKKLAGIRR